MSRLRMHLFPLAVVALATIPAVTLATATTAMARPVTAYVVNSGDDTVTPIDLGRETSPSSPSAVW